MKVKTSLFITPDFIIGKNPSKWEIMRQLAAKRKALFSKEYLFCEDCYPTHDDFVKEILFLDDKSIEILKTLRDHKVKLDDFKDFLLKLIEEDKDYANKRKKK